MNVSYLLQQNIPDLDPHSVKDLSIVSHGHSDHTAFNPNSFPRIIICTPATAEIIKHRSRDKNTKFIILNYGERKNLKDLITPNNKFDKDHFITLYPAGHVLGSAQVLLETNEKSLVYTGDFKLRAGLSCDKLEIPKADKQIDYLLMESTFAKPKYVFPEISAIKKRVINFCNISFDEKKLPILMGYSLGKSQEIIKLLEDQDFNIIVHGSIYSICEIYERMGMHLGKYKKYSKDEVSSNYVEKKTVLIIPPHFAKNGMVRNIPARKTAMFTGWAIDSSARYIYHTNDNFALSDHADYHELLEYVKLVNPQKTLPLHGYALELSKELNRLGFDAEPYDENPQMGLF